MLKLVLNKHISMGVKRILQTKIIFTLHPNPWVIGLIGLVLLFIFIPFNSGSAATCQDILIYSMRHPAGFQNDIINTLIGVGYNPTYQGRIALNELTPALLSNYGQIWIMDAHWGVGDINLTNNEVNNLVAWYNNGGRILLAGENAPFCIDDLNQVANQFNIVIGNGLPDGSEVPCSTVNNTGTADSLAILNGVNTFSTTGNLSNAPVDIGATTNPSIACAGETITNYCFLYILDETGTGKGRIVFHPSFLTFADGWGGLCDNAQYTINVAEWLCPPPCVWQDDNCGDVPCLATEMHQTCGPVGCAGGVGCDPSIPDTQCVPNALCAAVCGDGSCDFPETSFIDFPAFEILCPEDCGCDNDAICETERGENYWNCSLAEVPAVTNNDCPTAAGVDCLCNELPRHSEGQGLVPCGRNYDDPDTQSICECCPCTFCHTFLLMKRVIDFGTKQVLPALLVLVVIVAGVLYLVGGFSGSLISQAQGILKIMAIGAVIVLAGWIVVNTTLYAITGKQTDTGVAEIFAGSWDEITCDYGKTCTTSKCGDGIVQRPNWGGVDEECEINEKWEGFKARAQQVPPEAVDFPPCGIPLDENDYWSSFCLCSEETCLLEEASPCP